MKSRFTPRSRGDWRRWLEQNHDKRPEVWLVFWKKHTGKPSPSYDAAVEEALCFGWIDGLKRRIDDERYAFRFTPRKEKSVWSPSNVKRATRLIEAGLMTEAGLRLVAAAKASGAWDDAQKPQAFEMPAEFEKALASSKKARDFFDALTDKQKSDFIGWIASAKRPETRQKRLENAMELLRAGKKLGMV